MVYRGWQVNPKNDFGQEISSALQFYIDKHGLPAQVLEISDQLPASELPEGLQLVTNVVRIPKNIVLVGRYDETD